MFLVRFLVLCIFIHSFFAFEAVPQFKRCIRMEMRVFCHKFFLYTSGVYGELVLRSATTWPSGLLLVMVICSLCRTLEEMQDDAVTSGNNVFFVFFELCIWNAKWSGDDEHGCSPFRGL